VYADERTSLMKQGGNMRRVILFVLLIIPVVASAQEYRFELTPTLGYRFGGSMVIEENAFKPGIYEVDFATNGEWGLRLGYFMTPALELELMFSRQYTELKDNQGLFGEDPGGFIPVESTKALDTDVSTWQLGLVWHLMQGPTRPYVLVAAGQSKITSSTLLPDETAVVYGLGVGVKLDFTARFGLLIEGRYNWGDTDESNSASQEWEHRDCVGTCSYVYRYGDSFEQASLVAGLIINF
jgi:hypothetical protein